MKYTKWAQKPNRFLAMTGYSHEAFELLLPYFKSAHDEYLSKYTLQGKPRKGYRKFVIYSNSPLPTIEERLVFILSYLKLNPLQEHHADTFDMEQKQCNTFIHGLSVILEQALQKSGAMPASTQSELETKLAELSDSERDLFHDGTERQIPRPQDPDEQKDNYSGKKKKHTLKNAIISSFLCVVLFVSPTVNGRMHDKAIADIYYTIPKDFKLWQDTGYQGYNPDGVEVKQPIKKPKGKELTDEQKKENTQVSKVRVRVEHAIGSIKRMRIVKEVCRLRKNNFPRKIFKICAALHNFRLSVKPFVYEI